MIILYTEHGFFGRDKIENTDSFSFDLGCLGYDQYFDPISVVLPPDVNLVKAEFWYSENSDCSFRILTDDEVPKNTLFGCDATPAAEHGKFVHVSTDVGFSSKVLFLPLNKRLAFNVRVVSIYDPSDKSNEDYEIEISNGELYVVEKTNGEDLNPSDSPATNEKDLNLSYSPDSDSSVKNNSNSQDVADSHNVLSSNVIFIILMMSSIGVTMLCVMYCFCCLFLKNFFTGQEPGGAGSAVPAHSSGPGLANANSNARFTSTRSPVSAAPGPLRNDPEAGQRPPVDIPTRPPATTIYV